MSVDVDEVRALAHAFARQLEHLREFRGVFYVGAAPVPVSTTPDEAELDQAQLDQAQHEASIEPAPSIEPERLVELAPAEPVPVDRESRQPAAAAPQLDHARPRQQSPESSARQSSARPESSARPDFPPRPQSPNKRTGSAEQWSASEKLQYLRDHIGDCRRCPLARSRRNIVFGVGNPEADVMFIGEAPGADEDRLGEPFVGAAGRRLDQWIEHLGMRRADVYIANVLKCRPPGNRDPQSAEIERCSPFLQAQIRAVEPKVLIALGRFAGCLLLGRELKLWEMRGKVHSYREPKSGVEIPLLVTYHPAYVLRSEQRPPGDARGQPDRTGAIKSEDEKVLADLARARSLL